MRLLMTASNGSEAEMICARLRAASIAAITQGGAFAATAAELGARDIYVDEGELDRAREVLAGAEEVSEEELIRAQEEAASGAARHDRGAGDSE